MLYFISTPDGKFSVGENSKLGKGIGSLNRMPLKTCPGASEWCSKNCYAMNGAFRFWYDEYSEMIDELPDELPKVVRLHSAGDFDSVEYIDWIRGVVSENRETKFWAYTRSWRIDELKGELEKLKKFDNIQLFASIDRSIEEEPPKDWRVSWIEGDPRAEGIKCPHDQGKVDSCRDCGLCYHDIDVDIIFKEK